MASTKIDYEKAARILVDAEQLGLVKAAEKWKVSDRTIRNYRDRLGTDDQLSSAFRRLSAGAVARFQLQQAQAELGWRQEHIAALRETMITSRLLVERVRQILPDVKDPKELKFLLEAVGGIGERFSNVETSRDALGVGDRDGQEGAGPQAPPSGDAGRTTEAGPVQH